MVATEITAVVISHQTRDVPLKQIQKDLKEVAHGVLDKTGLLTKRTKYFINPTGRFVIGGPCGDAGVTGRKIIVDSYGGVGSHGGGAFPGKDPSKVRHSCQASENSTWKSCHLSHGNQQKIIKGNRCMSEIVSTLCNGRLTVRLMIIEGKCDNVEDHLQGGADLNIVRRIRLLDDY
jgi:hypothetical protein